MSRSVELIIKAKSGLAAGLSKATRSLKKFGAGVGKIGARVARFGRSVVVGMAVAGTAIIAFAAKSVQAWGVQEKAEKALASSLRSAGENADKLIPKLKKVASAIQDETGAADESTIAGMARLKLLGVTTERLGEAARATIALTAVGVDQSAALKMVAAAMAGDYTLLQRYIPSLKGATTATEKATIVNDLFAKGYKQQKAILKTTAGAWIALKGRVGDALEQIGRAIAKSSGLARVLETAGEKVKGFGEKIERWIDSEKFIALSQSIKGVVAAMGSSEGRGDLMKASGDVLKAAAGVAAENAVSIIKKASKVIGYLIAKGFKYAAKETFKSSDVTLKEETEAGEQLGFKRETKTKWRNADSTLEYSKDQLKQIEERVQLNRFKAEGVKLSEGGKFSEEQTPAEAKLAAAMAEFEATAQDYAPPIVPDEPAPPPIVLADPTGAPPPPTRGKVTAAQRQAIANYAARMGASVRSSGPQGASVGGSFIGGPGQVRAPVSSGGIQNLDQERNATLTAIKTQIAGMRMDINKLMRAG